MEESSSSSQRSIFDKSDTVTSQRKSFSKLTIQEGQEVVDDLVQSATDGIADLLH